MSDITIKITPAYGVEKINNFQSLKTSLPCLENGDWSENWLFLGTSGTHGSYMDQYHRLIAVSKDPKQSKGVVVEWASNGDHFEFIPTMTVNNPNNGHPSELDQLIAELSQETGWDEARVRKEFNESSSQC